MSCLYCSAWFSQAQSPWSFLQNAYLDQVHVREFVPNGGVLWYTYPEIFKPFRPWFEAVLAVYPAWYVLPLCTLFWNDGAFAFLLQGIVVALFRPVTWDMDLFAFLPLVLAFPDVTRRACLPPMIFIACLC